MNLWIIIPLPAKGNALNTVWFSGWLLRKNILVWRFTNITFVSLAIFSPLFYSFGFLVVMFMSQLWKKLTAFPVVINLWADAYVSFLKTVFNWFVCFSVLKMLNQNLLAIVFLLSMMETQIISKIIQWHFNNFILLFATYPISSSYPPNRQHNRTFISSHHIHSWLNVA